MPRFKNITQGPDDAVLEKRFAPAIEHADQARAAGVELAARLEQALSAVTARERSRVANKYGADSPEAETARAAARAQAQMAERARSNAQRARVAAPRADAQSFVVHGHAAEPNGRGIAGLLAQLTGPDGSKPLAKAKTDADGYFKLEVRGAQQPARTNVAVESSGRAAATAGSSVRLTIVKDDDELFRDDLEDLKLGEARYCEAVIGAKR